jgi:hypothetical protein
MKRAIRTVAVGLLLGGCSMQVTQVSLDSSSVVGSQSVSINPCGFRLAEVIDGRVDGGEAGGLSMNQLKVEDGPALLRVELLKAGLRPPDADGRDVRIELKQMYMTRNRLTKVPVVVYAVQADGMAPFLVRAQPARMNWNGTDHELLAGLSLAVHEANAKLMASLDGACPG